VTNSVVSNAKNCQTFVSGNDTTAIIDCMMTKTIIAISLITLLTGHQYTSAEGQQGSDSLQNSPYTLRLTRSEVVVDVIAADAHDHLVLNLVPADFEVFDKVEGTPRVSKTISTLRIVDPSSTSSSPDLPQTDFPGLVQGSCMLSYTAHYQLAYNPGPDQSVPGIHTVQIQVHRRGVKLSYRHGYFVSPPEGKNSKPPIVFAVSSDEPRNTTVLAGSEGNLISLGGNSFGSTVPSATGLCADVYEIPPNTKHIPDFRRLSPLGMVYTDFLSVTRDANIIGMGLPNITTRGEWVGLDYYGRFWITNPGAYHFQMIADDGARLEIDGKSVIDLDGIHPGKSGSGEVTLVAGPHSIHIPYFNGPRAAVLMLYVEAPGETTTLFNTRRFALPPAASH